jgi:hypothetical protein
MTKFFMTMAYKGIDLFDEDQLEKLIVRAPWIQWVAVDGEVRALITREADTPIRAALDAVENIRRVVPQARFVRMVEDLVSISDIGRRVGVNRETVRFWVSGKRGPGGFPRPRDVVGGNIQVWDWASVALWLCRNYAFGDERRPLLTEEIYAVQSAIHTFMRADRPWATTTNWDSGPHVRERALHSPEVALLRARSKMISGFGRFVEREGVSIETRSTLDLLKAAE